MGTRSWEGTQPKQVTPNDPRGIPQHMVSCSVDKLEGKLERPLLWDWLGIDQWVGSIVHHLFSTFWVFSPSVSIPLNCLYLKLQSFLFPISLHHPTGRSE